MYYVKNVKPINSYPLQPFGNVLIVSEISQITENIFLGNIYDAANIKKLSKLGIKKVLTLTMDTQIISLPKEFERKIIKVQDLPRENIIQYFGECINFIEGDTKILVHCTMGISRSPTIILAYLMWKNQLKLEEAFKLVRRIRNINPNYGFIRQLQIFEDLLKKNNYNINKINFREIKYPRAFQECCF